MSSNVPSLMIVLVGTLVDLVATLASMDDPKSIGPAKGTSIIAQEFSPERSVLRMVCLQTQVLVRSASLWRDMRIPNRWFPTRPKPGGHAIDGWRS